PSPTDVISWCRQIADLPRAQTPEDWLPAPVATDLARRDAAQLPTQSGHAGVAAPPPSPTAPSNSPPPSPAPGMATAPHPAYGPAPAPAPTPWHGGYAGHQPRVVPPPKRRRSGKIPLIIAAILSPLVLLGGCGTLVGDLLSAGDSGTGPPAGTEQDPP